MTDGKTHEYTFDVKMFASITVKAESVKAARAILADKLDCADCNGGAWDDGTPILFEATVDDTLLPCLEIDGEDYDNFEQSRAIN